MMRILIFAFSIIFFIGCQTVDSLKRGDGGKNDVMVASKKVRRKSVKKRAPKQEEKSNLKITKRNKKQRNSRAQARKEKQKKIQREQELLQKKQHEQRRKDLRLELKKTPLFEKWHYCLDQEKIKQIYYCDQLLFVETHSKKLFVFNGKTGIVQWMYILPEAMDCRPEISKDEVYILAMAKIHTLDKTTGKLLKQKELSFIPSSPLCVGDKYIYVGSWDNFLYALNKKDFSTAWRYRIDGIIQGQPCLQDGILFFPGTDKRIYAINAESGYSLNDWGKDSRYETRGSNVAGIHSENNPPAIYVGSLDYNLYSLNRVNGDLLWKFESGGEIRYKPYHTANTIYFASEMLEKKTMFYGIDIRSGELKSSVENGILFFFVGQFHDFVLRNDKKVVALSKKDKKQSIYDFKEFDFFISNPEENNIGFIATKDAFIFAIQEK